MKIKSIDLREDGADKKIYESLSKIGFVVLKNHGVNKYNIEIGIERWHEWFVTKTFKEKSKYKVDSNYVGYFPMFSENAKYSNTPDAKEFFHVKSSTLDPFMEKMPASLSASTSCLFNGLEQLGLFLLKKISERYSVGKELESSFHSDCLRSSQTLLRPIYYPSLEQIDGLGQSVRSAAHEDINYITLLVSGSAPGLQVLDNEGNWHDVDLKENEIVVNVGDMLQMATNGELRSTTHRVVNPENMNSDRVSIPLFIHPHPDTNLGEMTAKEYLNQRLQEIGMKK